MSITVAISSYKYGHLAAHAVDSVLSQTVKPDHVIFADDGIGDCKHIPKLYPEIEFIEREQNLGTVENFQQILNSVETEYVMFLGADNWLRQDTIEELSKEDTDIITYDILVVGEFPDSIRRHWNHQMKKYEGGYYWDRSSGHHGSMMYRADVARKAGGYAHSGNANSEEDMVLYNRMIAAGATRSHIPDAFLYYRRHRENYNPVA